MDNKLSLSPTENSQGGFACQFSNLACGLSCPLLQRATWKELEEKEPTHARPEKGQREMSPQKAMVHASCIRRKQAAPTSAAFSSDSVLLGLVNSDWVVLACSFLTPSVECLSDNSHNRIITISLSTAAFPDHRLV